MNPNDPERLRNPTNASTLSQEVLNKLPVFPLIHNIRRDIELNIDAALTWSQLTSPEVNFTVIRPLVFKYARLQNPAVVYVLLVVRSHFLSVAENDLAFASIIQTRASLCEVLAIKMLRHFTNDRIELAAVLTHYWNPLQAAPAHIVEQVKRDVGGDPENLNDPMSALEVAISTESKRFCSSPLVQNIINDIWQGRIVFSAASSHALVQDNYKSREISLYDPRDVPFLDHYRLRVPRYRAILEFLNFAILLGLFVLCLANKDLMHLGKSELVFMIFAFGFMLDEFAATQEHGWTFYIASMWNGFDMAFIAIFLIYFGLRIKGVTHEDPWYSDLAFDILSCGACLLFPRMAFFAVSNNVVILALQGMITEFLYFIAIAAMCFSGLLFTLHNLAGEKWPVKNIAWLMVQIWFGNTYLSFVQAESFHPIFGPILMVVFAALSNTLLITILISILSNTFARINENASEEFLFQFAISTLEGVKADAVLAYQPPFNLAAFVTLSVLNWFLSPRTLHTVNVFLIRLTSFPVLISIGLYERWIAPGRGLVETGKGAAAAMFNRLPRQIKGVAILDAIAGSRSNDLLDAVLNADYENGDHGYFGDDDGDGILNIHDREDNTKIVTTMVDDDDDDDGDLDAGDVFDGIPRSRYVSTTSRASPVTPRRGRSRSQRPDDIRQQQQPPALGSPLSRAFSQRRLGADDLRSTAAVPGRGLFASSSGGALNNGSEELIGALKRVEALLGEERAGSSASVAQEMKDMKERQIRIEELLMSLTREMRG